MLRPIAALLAGALTPLAFAPLDQYAWLLLTPALFFFALEHSDWRRGAKLGWLFGLGFYGVGTPWVYVSMVDHGSMPVPLAALLTLLFCSALASIFAAQAALYRHWLATGRCRWLSFIGLWLAFEWLRSWLLTGFPWLLLGYPLMETPLKWWAPIGGVWILSLLAVTISLSLWQLARPSGALQRPIAASLLVAITAATSLLPQQWNQAGAKLNVSIVQADIPQHVKWTPSELPAILTRYTTLSGQIPENTQLLIWPETAISAFYQDAEPLLSEFIDQLRLDGVSFISGLPTIEQDPEHPRGWRMHNSLANITEGGLYHKQRLVPFGEYVPLESQLRGLIRFFDLPMSSFSLPEQQQLPLQAAGASFASAICYEIAYPELVRQSASQANILLTVSNDTWFGGSWAPDQHFQIARMRALENGRWLIRSTNNGITGIVDWRGEVTAEAARFDIAVLNGQVESRHGTTPYQQLGVWPSLALALLLMLLAPLARIVTPRH